MTDKNLNDLNILSLIVVSFFGLLGGFLNYLRRLKTHPEFKTKQKILYFIVDAISTSSFSVITYLGLVGYGINDVFAVAVAGFIGHQGTRAIYLLEIFVAEKFAGEETINAIKEEYKRHK